MEARLCRPWMGLAAIVVSLAFCHTSFAQFGHARIVAQSNNFIVFAADEALAREVSDTAERCRKELALHWLGYELPTWASRVPVHVNTAPNMGASGETRFTLAAGAVGNWMMTVNGTRERVLDSVLPHEITHTILASHFAPLNKHVPRWADEGACTTVEHSSEQQKHKVMLNQFLQQGRGITFNRLFSLKDYPNDILPLYAQGHAVVEFLLAQGGPQKFVKFLEKGIATEQWEASVRELYGYSTLGELKVKWNQWLADGRREPELYVADSVAAARARGTLASAPAASSPLRVRANNDPVTTNANANNGNVNSGNVVLLGNLAANSNARHQDPPSFSANVPMRSRDNTLVQSNDTSWYKQQLERTLRPATTEANSMASSVADTSPNTQYGTGRREGTRQAQVQVLEWGR